MMAVGTLKKEMPVARISSDHPYITTELKDL